MTSPFEATVDSGDGSVKRAIEDALTQLVGTPLQYAYRAADLATFGFGKLHSMLHPRTGEITEFATFALHVQCPCRFRGPDGIIVGDHDMYFDAGLDPFLHYLDNEWEWSKAGANRYDERVGALIAAHGAAPLMVESIEAEPFGDFRLRLTGGIVFEAFVDESFRSEQWRLFRPGDDESHLVVFERDDDSDE